ncbi:MAG: methylmalonyl-CoA mutase family protein [Dehalococcoidia bacterium]|nr:methylmalonyl-CoA mutase family protein [Dehalococcoidia bacterium]
MPAGESFQRFQEAEAQWRQETAAAPEEPRHYVTLSNLPVERAYTPLHLRNTDPLQDIGLPGRYPFTRGIHATGYRGKLWTMRMFAGFGTAEETNARFKFLLQHGETGLSTAFDMPTLYGYDTDDPRACGEFGKCGVAVSSLADMEILFDGIPIDQITTSMTITAPAAVIWAMYLVMAEKRGIPWDRLGGTIQNDILKEYIAQNEYVFPPKPSLRLVVDTIEFASRYVPRWNPISISGYHIREAGSTAVQELAFTLADGFTYVEHCLERGLKIDEFAPRLSFFFNVHNDFFEEIAKFRAARRIWARAMRERYGAQNPRSWWLRTHAQTAGVALTAQQPEVNIIRVALQALAAVLGGTQSLHTNSLDEAWALPTEKAVLLALRTQQVIAYETGVAHTVDPLGGSYFVEDLTNRLEQAAQDYFRRIDDLGGVLACIENGFLLREIAEAAYRYQREVEEKKRIIVGVNAYQMNERLEIPLLRVDKEGERRHLERLHTVRGTRSQREVGRALSALRKAARGSDNLMPYILDAVRHYATLGEVMQVLRDEWGEYKPPTIL